MCLTPEIVRNPKYKKNKKNLGIVPWAKDPRILYIPVGCGKCIECKKRKTNEWKIRLKEEIKTEKAQFVTLTFNEKSLREIENEIEQTDDENEKNKRIITLATRRFLERWRKKHKVSVKHWLIAELGHNGTERLHLHGLIFTTKKEEIKNRWGYGYVYIGQYVSEKTINYIVKYITKIDTKHKWFNPKIMCSPGIGKNYTDRPASKLNKYDGLNTREYYQNTNGIKSGLPIYYRNKIYTEKQREQLWINRLNKNERYVLGVKIDVSTERGQKQYEKMRETAREKNKKLGYGEAKEWQPDNYAEHLKVLKQGVEAVDAALANILLIEAK
nr:MAG: replication initiator protein [Microviridae sp.]